MQELLLINPAKRRTARKTRKVAAKRRVRRNPVAARRAKNPVAPLRRRAVSVARRNPVRARRRRNPISLGSTSTYINMIKDAAIGGAGSVAVNVLMGYVKPNLPASMQPVAGKVGVYDVVKMVGTIALGAMLDRPTKGLAKKMALGSVTVQMSEMISSFVPATMALGYASPARVVQGSNRVTPLNLGLMTNSTRTPLLNRYTQPGASQMLSSGNASNREKSQTYAR